MVVWYFVVWRYAAAGGVVEWWLRCECVLVRRFGVFWFVWLLRYRLVWFWFPLVVAWVQVVGLSVMRCGLVDLLL